MPASQEVIPDCFSGPDQKSVAGKVIGSRSELFASILLNRYGVKLPPK